MKADRSKAPPHDQAHRVSRSSSGNTSKGYRPDARLIRIPLGKERPLRYTITALEALEADGFNVQEALLGLKRVTNTVQLIWRGLQHAEPNLTRDEVAGLLQIAADNGTPLMWYREQAIIALGASGIFNKEEDALPADPPPVVIAVDVEARPVVAAVVS